MNMTNFRFVTRPSERLSQRRETATPATASLQGSRQRGHSDGVAPVQEDQLLLPQNDIVSPNFGALLSTNAQAQS